MFQCIDSHFPPDQDEEEFLFEKGDLNLWAEPVQWVKLLHRHLSSLSLTLSPSQDPGPRHLDQAWLLRLSAQAEAQALASQQALEALPALPQFCSTMQHARLTLQHHRASLATDVLERLRQRN